MCFIENLPLQSPLVLTLMKEKDELGQIIGDYVRRLDELQSEILLYRAQRRIDEREMKILRRESEEKILVAKTESLESRMMIQNLQYIYIFLYIFFSVINSIF